MDIEKYKVVFEPGEDFGCKISNCTYVGRNSKALLAHLQSVHSKDKAFESECLFSINCFHSTKFRTYSALYAHIRKFHESFFEKDLPGCLHQVNHHQDQEHFEDITLHSSQPATQRILG